MVAIINQHLFNSNLIKSKSIPRFKSKDRIRAPKVGVVVRCDGSDENRRVTVRNGSDSLEICRVLNGMWQTSGGWGRIDRDDAVQAMLRYADSDNEDKRWFV
ncbi:hypothetical protein RJ641_033221 [Dillenia turbinata]|uniref:Uncharacterized protein n=1 Tax=Dillenia turbinata TaxID=194707 RepID=A0AAN8VUV6_9MAGN